MSRTSAPIRSASRVLSGARRPSVLLASLAAALALAAACSGSPISSVDPVDIDVAGASEDPAPAPEPDPARPGANGGAGDTGDAGNGGGAGDAGSAGDTGDGDAAGDATADDSPNDRPDPAGSDAAEAADGAADGNGGAAGEGDVDVGDGDTGSAEDGTAGTGNGDEVVATPGSSGTIGIAAPVTVHQRPRHPLTGELILDSTLAGRRALAVKVGNSDRRSRPQAGLAAADIVYETLIEGGRTRLMAVFHTEIPDRVGPVRSVRTSDFDLLADLSRPYLASSGANDTVHAETRRAHREGTLFDVGALSTFVPYSRDPARRSPHNLYFHYDDLVGADGAAAPGGPLEAPVAPLFDYGSPNPAGMADASGVTVAYHRTSGNVASHIWDAAVGGWVRIQDGVLMTTETGSGLAELAPANVAVVWMPHGRAPSHAESPLTDSYGTGEALVLTAGTVHHAVWERSEDRAGFRFLNAAGTRLSLSPGSTWVLIANSSRRFPVTEAEVLSVVDGARMLAEAREAARAAGTAASGP